MKPTLVRHLGSGNEYEAKLVWRSGDSLWYQITPLEEGVQRIISNHDLYRWFTKEVDNKKVENSYSRW